MAVQIAAEAVDETAMRPPKRVLWLDVSLENTGADLRWVLLPDRPQPPASAPVRRVERYELPATVLALRDVDAGGYALALPAGGRAILRRLPLSMWEPGPGELELDAVVASALTVDGSAPDVTPAEGEIDAAALENQRAVVHTAGGLGQPRVDVRLDRPETVRLTVSPPPRPGGRT